MLDQISTSLKRHFNAQLVDELLSAYQEAKHNFFLGGLRLSAVEGGRFCEAALRMLQQLTTGSFTSLNQTLVSDRIITGLANLPNGSHPGSIRLNIPRAIRMVYDIRNNRDAAHLADRNRSKSSRRHLGDLDYEIGSSLNSYVYITMLQPQRRKGSSMAWSPGRFLSFRISTDF